MVRALASDQCGPGSIPGPDAISGLSLCLFSTLPRGLFSGFSGFPPSAKTSIQLIPAGCKLCSKIIHEPYIGAVICFGFDLVELRRCCTLRRRRLARLITYFFPYKRLCGRQRKLPFFNRIGGFNQRFQKLDKLFWIAYFFRLHFFFPQICVRLFRVTKKRNQWFQSKIPWDQKILNKLTDQLLVLREAGKIDFGDFYIPQVLQPLLSLATPRRTLDEKNLPSLWMTSFDNPSSWRTMSNEPNLMA